MIYGLWPTLPQTFMKIGAIFFRYPSDRQTNKQTDKQTEVKT